MNFPSNFALVAPETAIFPRGFGLLRHKTADFPSKRSQRFFLSGKNRHRNRRESRNLVHSISDRFCPSVLALFRSIHLLPFSGCHLDFPGIYHPCDDAGSFFHTEDSTRNLLHFCGAPSAPFLWCPDRSPPYRETNVAIPLSRCVSDCVKSPDLLFLAFLDFLAFLLFEEFLAFWGVFF